MLDLWLQRQAAADEYRQLFEGRWIKNWQWYRNTKRTKALRGQAWHSNVQIPDAFRVVETMVPHHVLGMYRDPKWFSVEVPSAPNAQYQVDYQKMVHALLMHGWRTADMYRKTVLGLKQAHILGHVTPKIVWQVKLGEKEVLDQNFEFTEDGEPIPAGFIRRTVPDVVHNGPQVSLPDNFNVWQDPTGNEQWWIERIPASLSELREMNRQFGGTLYKNLGKIESNQALHRSLTNFKSYGSADENTLTEIVEGIPQQFEPDHVLLWQCWGYVPPSVRRYEDTQWRLVVIANKEVVIRDVPLPTHDHKPPYINVQSVPIFGQIYGDSVLSYIGDLIDLRSQIENMRRDEVLLNIHGQFAIDGNVQVRGQQMFKDPGGVLRLMLDGNQRLQDVFYPIPRQPVLNEAYAESAAKERQILDTSGATEPFQGTAMGSRTTATEAGMIMNLGTARVSLATFWLDETFKKPVLERFFKLYQSRMDTPTVVQLAGEEIRGEIDFRDLQYNVHVYVDSGQFGSINQQQMQALLQTYQVLLSNPDTAVWIDPAKFVERITYRAGINDNFLRRPDEVAAIQEEQRRAMLEQAILAGISGGSPGTSPGR